MLREDQNDRLIQRKLKVLFANLPKQELDCGLFMRKDEDFLKTYLREEVELQADFTKGRGVFFHKKFQERRPG